MADLADAWEHEADVFRERLVDLCWRLSTDRPRGSNEAASERLLMDFRQEARRTFRELTGVSPPHPGRRVREGGLVTYEPPTLAEFLEEALPCPTLP